MKNGEKQKNREEQIQGQGQTQEQVQGQTQEQIPKHYDAKKSEKKWQEYWEKEGVYRFDFNNIDRNKVFSIDTPPPTVSGKMHMGHAFGYSQADIIARYKRMQGYNVFYPFGFDDNGLATERFVEKKTGKRATQMKRSDFVKLCLEETTEAEKELKQSFMSIGLSADWSVVYRTIDPHCVKTSQKSFVELYKMGRAYRKESPTIWCPECQTAIAQVELEDKEIESYFNDILFELENGEKITIATTRPELLPACVAVFVHPEDERYKDLVGKKAKVPLFNFEVPIIADKRADPEKGTGIVMCCTFGDQTDMEWWKAYNLPLKIVIGTDGKMNERAGKYAGLTIKEARKQIIEDLKKEGLLVKQKKIKHIVNVHERCGTEIEFLVTKQWFIKYLDLKDEFLKLGSQIKWHPEHMKSRLENWIKGLQWDWCISRQRFFGVPFPVWYCQDCGHIIVADEEQLPVDPTETRPEKCPKCGSTNIIPEKDVLDTWATSSLTPQIALDWVGDWKDKTKQSDFFTKMFPMDLRPQGHDIISFWAFNTIVKAYFHNKSIPWKNIMINGWALDQYGKKMSKSKGNVIDPLEMIQKYNADALRWWAASSKLGEDVWFSEKEFVNAQRLMTKLWNASRFVIMHLKDYKPPSTLKELKEPNDLKELKNIIITKTDKWIISKLNKLVKGVTESLNNYEYIRLRLDLEKFFWHDFCDEYLELVKDRLYNKEKYKKEEVESAQHTLYYVLLTILKLLAPIMPHITEEIYHLFFKQHEGKKSVHITKWPQHSEELNFEEENNMEEAIKVLALIRKYKSDNKMSLKKEINKVVVESKNKDIKIDDSFMREIQPAARFKDYEVREITEEELKNGVLYESEDKNLRVLIL